MYTAKFNELEINLPIIFPDKLVHSVVANHIEEALQFIFPTAFISAKRAGTIDLNANMTYGLSETMGLISGKEDKSIINLIDINDIVT